MNTSKVKISFYSLKLSQCLEHQSTWCQWWLQCWWWALGIISFIASYISTSFYKSIFIRSTTVMWYHMLLVPSIITQQKVSCWTPLGVHCPSLCQEWPLARLPSFSHWLQWRQWMTTVGCGFQGTHSSAFSPTIQHTMIFTINSMATSTISHNPSLRRGINSLEHTCHMLFRREPMVD